MKENLLMTYSLQLATKIIAITKPLKCRESFNTIQQILKSSSSIYANISEAQYAQSLPDMLSKLKIARKECMETESWLALLFHSNQLSEDEYKNARNQCGRIRRLLSASCKTIEKKINEAN